MKSCNIRVGYKWKEQYNKWIGINIIWDFFPSFNWPLLNLSMSIFFSKSTMLLLNISFWGKLYLKYIFYKFLPTTRVKKWFFFSWATAMRFRWKQLQYTQSISSSGVFQQCFSGVRQMPRPLHDTKAQFYRFQYNEPIFCCKEIAASIW